MKIKSPRNKTLTISEDERSILEERLFFPKDNMLISVNDILNKTICTNLFSIIDYLPKGFADLLILDPPYNLDKSFNGYNFKKTSDSNYYDYIKSWFPKIIKTLKPTGSLYIFGDWKSTFCLYQIMRDFMIIRNRIVWEREKGRGAKSNWKNSCEDIWYGTLSNDYYFNVDVVKQKRKVITPYKEGGKPKDWIEEKDGKFRLTHPSNFWNDITIPFWSMSENTDHPTQKPEKLISKLILASCPENGIVFDPFLGSGTTSVVAKKLLRRYIGIEQDKYYCCLTEKRLKFADSNKAIQGYSDGIFWERNSKIS
jgi:site-specific DNA-methyltransferase (adenine-specific)